MKKILSLFILILASVSAMALGTDFIYQKIDLEQGLHPNVLCVETDFDNNEVWAGTRNGIGRFDGYSVQMYLDGNISQVLRDEEGTIWCISIKGVYYYDRESDKFVLAEDTEGNPVIASCMCLTESGVAFGARNAIYKYSYNHDKIELASGIFGGEYNITSIISTGDNIYICSNRWKEPLMANISTGLREPMPFPDTNLAAMYLDRHNRLWIAPYNGGLKCYNREGELIKFYDKFNSPMQTNIVLCITEVNGRIVIGTDGEGIYIINPANGEMQNLRHIPGNANSLPENSITCLKTDHQGNIWAGTVRGGLVRIKQSYMQFYTEVGPGLTYGVTDKSILSVYKDAQGIVWLGTDGGGINRYDPATTEFKHYLNTMRQKVVSIAECPDGRLMLFLYGEGLVLFDKNSGAETPITLLDNATDKRICKSGQSVHIAEDADGNLLILCKEPYRYNPRTGQFTKLKVATRQGVAGQLLPMRNSRYTGYFSDQLHIFQLEGDQFITTYTSHQDTLITAATMNNDGEMWIGTNFGFGMLDPNTGKVKMIPTTLAKPVKAMVFNDDNTLWIGTDIRLFSYEEGKGANGGIRRFDVDDGLQHNEYMRNCVLSTNDDNVYIGGAHGFLHILGTPPLERVGDIDIQTRKLTLKDFNLPPETKNISIPDKRLPLKVEVSAVGKDIFAKPVYRFRVDGHLERTEYNDKPECIIETLPYGKYNLYAACTNSNADWNEVKVATIRIRPPWFKSMLCPPIFILLCIFGARLLVINSKEKKSKEIARKLLAQGVDVEEISKATGLSKQTIAMLD